MTKVRLIICCLVFGICFLVACTNSQSPINELRSLVERIDEGTDDYTDEDWECLINDFLRNDDELCKYEYTEEELHEINRLQGKFIGKVTKSAAKDIRDYLEDFSNQFESLMDGFLEEFEDVESWDDL